MHKISVFADVLLMFDLLKSFLSDFGLSFLKLRFGYTGTTAKLHCGAWLKSFHSSDFYILTTQTTLF